ncbi:16533_t:CDS:10, partial [Funneliformis mosseae]
MEQASVSPVSNYFHEFDPLKWSLIDFLNWRLEASDFLIQDKEHGTFRYSVEKIANGWEDEICVQKAQEILDNWTVGIFYVSLAHLTGHVSLSHLVLGLELVASIKCSSEVTKFWNDRNIQDLREKIQQVQTHNELKLFQIESEDLNYALDRSKNFNFNALENRRKTVLEKDMSSSSSGVPSSHSSCSSTSGPSAKPHRKESNKIFIDIEKPHKILYSWKDAIGNIDFREVSKKDWIFENYNLSNEFRNFQQLTIKQVEENPYLCYKEDINKILCLSNIMLVEQKKPSYLTCDQAIWNTICRRQTSPVLSLVIMNVIQEYSSLLNCFASLDEIEDSWCANFAKVTELNKEDRANFCKCQIILRNFFLLGSINKDNEDTFVHSTLHDLINEVFRDPLLELVWANSESTASKRQRSNDKENTVKGNKPDFKILNNARDEILFGEVKPKDSSSVLVKKDFIKLGDFQVVTLNEIIKKYGNKNGLISFGIWVTGARIRFYEMDLNYDGIYRMILVANVVIPTERAQFLNLVTVLEAFFNIK